jgi:hypothetical protein
MAVLFMVTSMTLTIILTNRGSTSVIDESAIPATVTPAEPATPATLPAEDTAAPAEVDEEESEDDATGAEPALPETGTDADN